MQIAIYICNNISPAISLIEFSIELYGTYVSPNQNQNDKIKQLLLLLLKLTNSFPFSFSRPYRSFVSSLSPSNAMMFAHLMATHDITAMWDSGRGIPGKMRTELRFFRIGKRCEPISHLKYGPGLLVKNNIDIV